MKIFSKFVLLSILFGFILAPAVKAENVINLPNSVDEAKEMGRGVLPMVPNIIKSIWNDGAGTMNIIFNTITSIWNNGIYPYVDKYIMSTVRQRAPKLGEQLQNEKKEMTEDAQKQVPQITQTVWDKLKEMFGWK